MNRIGIQEPQFEQDSQNQKKNISQDTFKSLKGQQNIINLVQFEHSQKSEQFKFFYQLIETIIINCFNVDSKSVIKKILICGLVQQYPQNIGGQLILKILKKYNFITFQKMIQFEVKIQNQNDQKGNFNQRSLQSNQSQINKSDVNKMRSSKLDQEFEFYFQTIYQKFQYISVSLFIKVQVPPLPIKITPQIFDLYSQDMFIIRGSVQFRLRIKYQCQSSLQNFCPFSCSISPAKSYYLSLFSKPLHPDLTDPFSAWSIIEDGKLTNPSSIQQVQTLSAEFTRSLHMISNLRRNFENLPKLFCQNLSQILLFFRNYIRSSPQLSINFNFYLIIDLIIQTAQQAIQIQSLIYIIL
ncbi:hypothetical protein pb186bvf_001165 [Paramecium bursaria]